MNLGHCPLCWDGYSSCRCSASELKSYHDNIDREKKAYKEEQRRLYHESLDKTLDNINVWQTEEMPVRFLKEYLRCIDKPTWIELRKQLDKKFNIL
jgi:hypothetical protein